ncbi:MAG TPA: 1,3-propanediol dehydrogenase, partial [Bacillota bacterium]|nr:1,3-propanediol dehydrogenase [Bacillota bacterium]
NLRELGVKEEDFEKMAKLALEDGNAFSNPIQGKEEDIINIFKSAY